MVSEYRYLGVVFRASRKWKKQTDRLLEKGVRKFHQSIIAWAEDRRLHTGFRRSLFQAYVLPSIIHGSAFLDDRCVRRLDKQVRQWGRRLLGWPAAVIGQLGWAPVSAQVHETQARLFGRVCSADPHGARRSLAARIFRYAFGIPSSWAHQVRCCLRIADIPLPVAAGVVPGCDYRSLARWKHRFARPALDQLGFQLRQAEVAQLTCLALFNLGHPCPCLNFRSDFHSSRLPRHVVREWTLARCGSHPALLDTAVYVTPACAVRWSLLHTLRDCPIFLHWRNVWLNRLQTLGSGWWTRPCPTPRARSTCSRSGDAAELRLSLLIVRERYARRHQGGLGVHHVVSDWRPMCSIGLPCKQCSAPHGFPAVHMAGHVRNLGHLWNSATRC